MAQEQINGFKKITQSFGGNALSTEFDGEYLRMTGPNYIECRPSLKVNNMINGYGGFHYMIGQQPMYMWKHMVQLSAYDPGDDVIIFNGESLVPDVNPFARIFGDDFSSCVIWPVKCEIFGNGYDNSNYVSVDIDLVGTHYMPDDTTYTVSTLSLYSTTMTTASFTNSYPFRANNSVIIAEVNYISETGTAADEDHNFNIVCTLVCQKIEI